MRQRRDVQVEGTALANPAVSEDNERSSTCVERGTKAAALFRRGMFAEALEMYHQALEGTPGPLKDEDRTSMGLLHCNPI